MSTMDSNLLQLRIELKHSQPLVWRRLLVSQTITLMKLHRIIQEAMGWADYHLHEFIIAHQHYGVMFPEDPAWNFGREIIDEKRKRLIQVLGNQKRFDYVYDFGDGWQHEVTLETTLPAIGAAFTPICIDGEMACPPEDVGGLAGYFEFLEAMSNPLHQEHENMVQWWGGIFDPKLFDIEQINHRLRRIQ